VEAQADRTDREPEALGQMPLELAGRTIGIGAVDQMADLLKPAA
jgi:hypothetical protein